MCSPCSRRSCEMRSHSAAVYLPTCSVSMASCCIGRLPTTWDQVLLIYSKRNSRCDRTPLKWPNHRLCKDGTSGFSPAADDDVQAMLANAVRICDAKFGTLYRYDNEAFDPVALFGAPPAYVEFVRQRGLFQPPAGIALDRLLRTNVVHIADASAESATAMGAAAKFASARTLLVVPMLKESA